MSHTALARKYRPRRFSEVATQGHVSETLRRAVQSGRVGHAYLFCGPRGVGKTTLARVLAMALNCPERTDEGEPCGTCESCTRIWGGHTALDVVEIDAASNRGVDDARELRARAQYAPSDTHRHKVYIVDEAHMLTREAWNALLKVLEEPPPRVIFVFATTEPQKIQQSAAPILSRCQRFDFRRIGVADIVSRLADVLEREGLEGPDDALRTIARKADGGMRDGLSLLDQVIALTGGPVNQEAVRRILGLVEEERYVELLDILLNREAGRIFTFIDALVEDGYDLVEFYHGLVEALRLLLRIRLEDGVDLTDVREDLRDAFRERASRFEAADLVRMLAMGAELEIGGSLRRTVQPRMLIEMLLLRFAYLDRTVDLEEVLRSLGGAPVAARSDAPSTKDPSAEARRPGDATRSSTEGTAEAPGSAGGAGRAEGARPNPSAASAATAHPSATQASAASTAPPPETTTPASTTREPATAPVSSTPGTEPATPGSATTTHAPVAAAPAPAPPASTAPVPDPAPTPEATADVAEAWRRVLEGRSGLPGGLGPFLKAGSPRRAPDGTVEVVLPPGPGLDRLSEPAVHAAVERAFHRHVEGEPRLVFAARPTGGASARITPEAVRQGRLQELIEREPLLGRAVEELDLELLD